MMSENEVMRLHDLLFENEKNITKSEVIGIARFSSNNLRKDATFCPFDRCKDCGCYSDHCSCDMECRKHCSCESTCDCMDHYGEYGIPD